WAGGSNMFEPGTLSLHDALPICHGMRRLTPALSRYNVPAPVIGGLLVALVMLAARSRGATPVTFDTRLQAPFMIAFFTTVGFGAGRKSTRLNSSHDHNTYAVFCL